MAAVTVTNTPTRHVFGDCVAKFFQISGASGTTLQTGMSQILFIAPQPFCAAGTASLITGLTVAAGIGGSVITFTTGGGAMVNEIVEVIGRVG